ncbi:hypothetical protein BD289DRAFT_458672 [Coniella lustricola]|uniref:Zn(2)-C6 fungal-type domain-containing protein n=1 Tax=Coniella lustricola TaxID=2025994 RepID=A0A2T3AI38_9PEZI|nr:hypothetical protein BD289DRAFT_458672 [Coniella lustricola]
MMAYNCQACVRRKVKCNRASPKCSWCVKYSQECIYRPPPKPRRKKRKATDTEDASVSAEEDIQERLARYERILRRHGLLDVAEDRQGGESIEAGKDIENSKANQTSQVDSVSLTSRSGRFVSEGAKSRYINSAVWLSVGDAQLEDLSDESDGSSPPLLPVESLSFDPIFGTPSRAPQSLLHAHPSHEDALKLWRAHVHNIEPLCRILHIPTTTEMITSVSRNPATATRSQECQLFAIYHSAVYSLSDEDCQREFYSMRSFLLVYYQQALRQALVNASWLKTTEFTIMQAYLLFLICARSYLDPHTLWILTGIGVRIAQRMGLHRDPGEITHLPPFEVQMRRRLFWQLVPLDGFAGQHSGTGISIPPSAWDVRKPLNVDDAEIYPGMEAMPSETKGATDMIFVLVRAELSEFYTRKALNWGGKDGKAGGEGDDANGPSAPLRSAKESLDLIDEVEASIEEKFLRYCDIVTANVVRLRHRIQPLLNKEQRTSISHTERRSLCDLAQKILDANNAIHSHPGLKPWLWQVHKFYLWDALMCMLKSITASSSSHSGASSGAPLLTRDKTDAAWNRLAETVRHHPEIMTSRRVTHTSIWKAMVEAWSANPASSRTDGGDEPALFDGLRTAVSGETFGLVPNKANLQANGSDHGIPVEARDFGSDFAGSRPDVVALEDLDLQDWAFWDELLLNPASEVG